MIPYGCFYKRSSKPVKKGGSVETIEAAIKDNNEILDQGGKRLILLGLAFSQSGRYTFQSYPKSSKLLPVRGL